MGIGDLDDNNDLMAHAAAINSLMPAIASAGSQSNANANVVATTAGAGVSPIAAGATNVAHSNIVASDEHNFASVSMLLFLLLFYYSFYVFSLFFFFVFIFYCIFILPVSISLEHEFIEQQYNIVSIFFSVFHFCVSFYYMDIYHHMPANYYNFFFA